MEFTGADQLKSLLWHFVFHYGNCLGEVNNTSGLCTSLAFFKLSLTHSLTLFLSLE